MQPSQAVLSKHRAINRFAEVSGGLFLLLLVTILPYLMYLHPNYQYTLESFTAMTSLGLREETAILFNSLLVVEGLLMLLYYKIYFEPSRTIYEQMHGWKAVTRLHVCSAIGIAGVGLFPDEPNVHAIHVIAAALTFGCVSFAIMVMALNFFSSVFSTIIEFRLLAIFGSLIVALGFSYTSIFVFINTNQGLWQTIQLAVICLWYSIEYILHYKYKIVVETFDPELIREQGLSKLFTGLKVLLLYSTSLIIIGIFGFIDIEILSTCTSRCKPNMTDYRVMFYFGLLMSLILSVIWYSKRKETN